MSRAICTFIFFLFYLKIFVYGGNVDLCSTPENTPGNCVEIRKCPSLLSILLKKPISSMDLEFLKKTTCGYQGIHPKVCCSIDDCIEDNELINPLGSFENISDSTQNSLLPDLNVCGANSEDRLIDGVEAQLATYTWAALLQYQTANGLEFHCGGVLINERYVLTAAHCVVKELLSPDWSLISVRLGEHDVNCPTDCENFYSDVYTFCNAPPLDISVEQIIVHSEFNYPKLQHDIALIRLEKKINYTDFVNPICLEVTSNNVNTLISGSSAYAVGWGANENALITNNKSRTWMQIKDTESCAMDNLEIGIHLTDQICAILKRGAQVFYGDSGGVLQGWNSVGNFFALGITTKTYGEHAPIVFTNVKEHTPWILDNLKP